MTWYKNVGTRPWKRANGKAVGAGQCFEATPKEESRINRRAHYQARLQVVDAPPESQAPARAATPGKDQEPVWPAEWTLKMSPKLYLKIHPSGPHAELAQKLVDAWKASLEQDEDGDGEDEDQ